MLSADSALANGIKQSGQSSLTIRELKPGLRRRPKSSERQLSRVAAGSEIVEGIMMASEAATKAAARLRNFSMMECGQTKAYRRCCEEERKKKVNKDRRSKVEE